MLDLKIVGGTIVDGSGAAKYRGDVGVKDGVIVALGTVSEDARETIDATGKVVSPGFIDVHTHYDAQVFWDPTLSPSCYHGITTVFGGYCGFSIAPMSADAAEYLMPMLARVEGMPLDSLKAGVPWNWTSFEAYLKQFEGTIAINAGFLAGHSTIRRIVMGKRAVTDKATRAELDEMKKMLREAIKQGALGFSTTISPSHNDADGNPVPSRAASMEEILELYSVISEYEGTVAEMLPGVDFTPETYENLTRVSLAAKRPVNWNAIAVHSANKEEIERNEHKLGASDYARERGATVIALTLSKTATMRLNMLSGFVFDLIPGWEAFFTHPLDERIKLLKDPAYRKELKAMAESMPGMLKEQFVWSRMKVTETFAPETKKYEGRTLGDIAKAENRDAFDVFCDITIADGLRARFMPGYPAEGYEVFKERARLWDDPRTVVGGSDAGAHLDMIDTFLTPTTLLAYGVREQKVMTIEQGVHQLTEKPAKMMGLKNRGVLKQGWHADIVVFDPETVGPGAVVTRKDLPAGGERLYADANGISNVVVNGREIIRNNKYLGVPAGAVLRSGKDTYTVTIPAAS